MYHLLDFACEDEACARGLTERELILTYTTGDIERRAYECACGTVTITVGRV